MLYSWSAGYFCVWKLQIILVLARRRVPIWIIKQESHRETFIDLYSSKSYIFSKGTKVPSQKIKERGNPTQDRRLTNIIIILICHPVNHCCGHTKGEQNHFFKLTMRCDELDQARRKDKLVWIYMYELYSYKDTQRVHNLNGWVATVPVHLRCTTALWCRHSKNSKEIYSLLSFTVLNLSA